MRCGDDAEARSRILDLGGTPDGVQLSAPLGSGTVYTAVHRNGVLLIAVSGASGDSYAVTREDVDVCVEWERRIDARGWGGDVDVALLEERWGWPPSVLSAARYPELH